jgi:hypothetical protein
VAQLQGVYQILPDFVPTPVEGVNVMRIASAIPDEFLEASAVTAEDETTMQTTTGRPRPRDAKSPRAQMSSPQGEAVAP